MKDIEKVLYTEAEIQAKVAELGRQITRDYAGKNLLLCCILKGSLVFMSDLMRQIDLPLTIDFMKVSSYGHGTESSGDVRVLLDLSVNLPEYDLLIVEDIFDSGRTLAKLTELLRVRGPRSLKLCTLFSKPERHNVELNVDYLGFELPDEFVVGYGLDYAEHYRNLPYLGVLKREVYE